jgi:hypothetical protein
MDYCDSGSVPDYESGIRILDVAGPRASKEPEIGEFVKRILHACQNTIAV